MAQAGDIDGFTPTMEGRMVRTDRYKYCVYSRGTRRADHFVVDPQHSAALDDERMKLVRRQRE